MSGILPVVHGEERSMLHAVLYFCGSTILIAAVLAAGVTVAHSGRHTVS